jgi:aspartyl-tRNA synthetase
VSFNGDAGEKLHVAQPLKALCVPGWASASRSQLDKVQEMARSTAADWFSYIKVEGTGIQSPLAKAVGNEAVQALATAAGAQAGDLVILLGLKSGSVGSTRTAQNRLDGASGDVRTEVARRLDLIKPGAWSFAWVVDFPMFEYNDKANRYQPMHHPFTSPREEDYEKLESDTGAVKARAYDLVLNGSEIGGGSIRIHRHDIQERVFQVLGLTSEQARARFGFFLDALEYGTPPHGGIALGFDRLVALMAGESNIREVIAFPKTASAMDMMCDAPAEVDQDQLEDLGLQIAKKVE